ncbi:MAG: hypothetical protein ABFS34_10685 [Gemmatimonadota bacterium]
MSESTGAAQPLAPEIAGLLTELAAALNRHGMYPPGHPALAQAASALAARAEEPLAGHGNLVFGFARDRVLHEETESDPGQPMLRDLADRLHRRSVAGLRIARGFDEAEAAALLAVLGPEPEADEAGPAPWRSRACELIPARYDRLTLTDPDAAKETVPRSLWGDLARSAFGDDAPAGLDPRALARAINERGDDDAFDGALAARLSGLLVGSEGLAASPELTPQVAELLRSLDAQKLRRLLQLAGSRGDRAAMLRGALRSLPADAVLALLNAARGPEQSISDSLMRILGKLSAHAPTAGPTGSSTDADGALRSQIEELVTGWQLDDPNPEMYTEALQGLAAHRANRPSIPTADCRPAPVRVVRMAVELGTTGPVLDRAVTALDKSDPTALLKVLADAPEGLARDAANAAVAAGWAQLARPDSFLRVLDESAYTDAGIELLIQHAGPTAIDPLLDRLVAAEDRSERRWLLNRLAEFGDSVAAPAMARLEGAPWFFMRNILHLLRQVGTTIPDIPPDPYLTHEDPRVRLEAVRFFAATRSGERAIAAAIVDSEPSVVGVGLALAAEDCPPAVVSLLAHRVADRHLPVDLRAQAVRILADHPTREGLDALKAIATRGRSLLLRRIRFPAPSPLSLGAISALVRGWPEDDFAVELRKAAESAKHGAIRAAVRADR